MFKDKTSVNSIDMIPSNNPNKNQTETDQIVTHPPAPAWTHLNTDNVPYLYQPQPQPVVIITNGANINHPMTQQIGYISEYRKWSIFNIFCCCVILGIMALMKSRETRDRKCFGDLQGALKASKSAKHLNICATVIGIIITAIVVTLRAIGIAILNSYPDD